MQIAIVVCALAALALVAHAAESPFNVRPNGRIGTASVTMEDGSATCHFQYQAVGGTNEEWMMDIQRSRGHVTCTIGRPSQASYLLFQSFSAKLEGAVNRELSFAEVWDNDGALLQGDAFVLDGLSVNMGKNFGGILSRVTLSD
eukprot:Amastigsp_a2790_153.p2 type:complete len:144 gc:universal Amastigsp_a2790_153:40-471(+)